MVSTMNLDLEQAFSKIADAIANELKRQNRFKGKVGEGNILQFILQRAKIPMLQPKQRLKYLQILFENETKRLSFSLT